MICLWKSSFSYFNRCVSFNALVLCIDCICHHRQWNTTKHIWHTQQNSCAGAHHHLWPSEHCVYFSLCFFFQFISFNFISFLSVCWQTFWKFIRTEHTYNRAHLSGISSTAEQGSKQSLQRCTSAYRFVAICKSRQFDSFFVSKLHCKQNTNFENHQDKTNAWLSQYCIRATFDHHFIFIRSILVSKAVRWKAWSFWRWPAGVHFVHCTARPFLAYGIPVIGILCVVQRAYGRERTLHMVMPSNYSSKTNNTRIVVAPASTAKKQNECIRNACAQSSRTELRYNIYDILLIVYHSHITLRCCV